jgi:hypothetical protein
VGVNHAPVYTSYEGDRSYDKPEDGGAAPADEAVRAIRDLDAGARPHFAELVVLPFEATNRPPYPFAWRDRQQTLNEYTAACQRILALYDARFG